MVKVKSFNCKNCGASVEERAKGWSLSVVCSSCGAVIDLTDTEKKIISKIDESIKANILIPLGQRGNLKGKEWEIIGYIEKIDPKYDVLWSEYLLFNPKYGFRWLTEYNGHWNFVTMLKETPTVNVYNKAKLNHQVYALYNKGQAQVHYVLGEFYWKVHIGDQVTLKEYIDPPYSLSVETTDDESVWSIGEYIELEELEQAFNLATLLPARFGVSPNQPSPHTKNYKQVLLLWPLFIGVLFIFQFIHLGASKNEKIYEKEVPIVNGQEFMSPVFKLKGNTNAEISLNAPVDNSWVYANTLLVNEKNGKSYNFEKTIEYYHGYDGGESWSEGDREERVMLSRVPAGDYYLLIESTKNYSNPQTPNSIFVKVKQSTPIWSNFFWALLFISIPPFINCMKLDAFERERWSNSDYSPFEES